MATAALLSAIAVLSLLGFAQLGRTSSEFCLDFLTCPVVSFFDFFGEWFPFKVMLFFPWPLGV